MDASQILKSQIGELAFNNAVLMAQVEDLKNQLEEKNGPTKGKPAKVD